jgi:hypothetical protein
MTTSDIVAFGVLVKLKDGRVMQVKTNSENRNLYLSMINSIENGIEILNKDFSESVEIEVMK